MSMLDHRFVEIRDAGTTIPALAFRIQASDGPSGRMMQRAGYGATMKEQMSYIVLIKLDGMESRDDPFDWNSGARTMLLAHAILYGRTYIGGFGELIAERCDPLVFDLLPQEGAGMIDIEYCLGLKDQRKLTEFGQ